jgi:hypothetical protein
MNGFHPRHALINIDGNFFLENITAPQLIKKLDLQLPYLFQKACH